MTIDNTKAMTLEQAIVWVESRCYANENTNAAWKVIKAHLAPREVMDGWEYHVKGPKEGGDQRCICTIETDGMVYVGIAIWTANSGAWFQNGTPLTGRVLAWKPLPEPAKGRWARGKLIGADDALQDDRGRGGE